MASLTELVASPALQSQLSFVVRPRSPRAVTSVAFAEDLADIGDVEPGAVVLLSRAASATAGSYRFDMALRAGRTREVAALVMAGEDAGRITATASAVADRSRSAILATVGRPDLAELAIRIGRELAGGADAALLRAHAAVRAVEAHPADGRHEALVERAGAALGVPLAFGREEPAGMPRRPVLVDGRVDGWMSGPPQEGELAKSLELVLRAVADTLGRDIERVRSAEELPIQSQEEALAELLVATPQDRPRLLQRARSLGLPIDGWHVAVRLEISEQADAPAGDGYEQRLRLARAALEALRADGGAWHTARIGSGVILVRMHREDPGLAGVAEVTDAMRPVLARVHARLTGGVVRCGVGGVHQGPSGLISSALEAKAAVTAARASGSMNEITPFDSVGLRRAVIDWYASETAQEAVTAVLAPLARLGGARAERLIGTLHVYLDQQGSLSKTAAALNLHRNAVAYRVNQIFDLLEVDPDNPDDRLLLQLACRARELP
jgi:sugar diacid utilization regulator